MLCSGAGTGADHSRFLHIQLSLFVMKMLRCLQHCYECEEDEESVSPLKVDKFLNIRNVSGEFIFILQMFTLQIVDKSTSYTFKIVN